MAARLFFGGKKGDEMKNMGHSIALGCFTRNFFWIFILFITSPSWAASFCIENEIYAVNESAKATSNEDAVNIAKQYLNIENTINLKSKLKKRL